MTVKVTDLVGLFSQHGHPVILVIYDSQLVVATSCRAPRCWNWTSSPQMGCLPWPSRETRQVLDTWKRLRDGFP